MWSGVVVIVILAVALCIVGCCARKGSPDIVFVTAFLDLNRGEWEASRRTHHEYLCAFVRLARLPIPLIVYVDTKVFSKAFKILSNERGSMGVFTKIIRINDRFLTNEIHAFSPRLVAREEEIMRSAEYVAQTSHRRHYPENSVPKYNLINHAKIDFVVHALDHPDTPRRKFYAWIDFGYIHGEDISPKKPLRTDSLKAEGVTFMTVNDPNPDDGDALFTLLNAPEKFAGGFFTGSPGALRQYQKAYHAALDALHRMNIADDDQAVTVHMYFHRNFMSPPLHIHRKGFKGALKWLAGDLP